MDSIAKNTRKKAKKASSGGGRFSGREEKQVVTLFFRQIFVFRQTADIQAA
jgi:hypothetical protein